MSDIIGNEAVARIHESDGHDVLAKVNRLTTTQAYILLVTLSGTEGFERALDDTVKTLGNMEL